MKNKIPKPRVNDNVEMIDFSKCFGRVIKIVSNYRVKVNWGSSITIEKIKDLALVRRVY